MAQFSGTTTLSKNATNILLYDYITPELGFSIIPGGVQRFHLHFLKPASNDHLEVYVEIQLANFSGETFGPPI